MVLSRVGVTSLPTQKGRSVFPATDGNWFCCDGYAAGTARSAACIDYWDGTGRGVAAHGLGRRYFGGGAERNARPHSSLCPGR